MLCIFGIDWRLQQWHRTTLIPQTEVMLAFKDYLTIHYALLMTIQTATMKSEEWLHVFPNYTAQILKEPEILLLHLNFPNQLPYTSFRLFFFFFFLLNIYIHLLAMDFKEGLCIVIFGFTSMQITRIYSIWFKPQKHFMLSSAFLESWDKKMHRSCSLLFFISKETYLILPLAKTSTL